MHCTLTNSYSEHFYILSIFLFIITVSCAKDTSIQTNQKNNNRLKVRNIRSFSFDEWDKFCESFDTVLVDLNAFKASLNSNKYRVEALKKLENANKRVIFYTKTLDPSNNISEQLKGFGYTTEFELVNPINALKWHLEKNGLYGKAYFIGDENFKIVTKSEDLKSFFFPDSITFDESTGRDNVELDNDVKAVIIDFSGNINIFKITEALRYLQNPEVQLFITKQKSIFGSNYFDVWINKLIKETNRTKQYIDRLNGIFGDYIVEKYDLTNIGDKVLFITSDASGSLNFVEKNKLKPLLIRLRPIKDKVTTSSSLYYYVDNITKIPYCSTNFDYEE